MLHLRIISNLTDAKPDGVSVKFMTRVDGKVSFIPK